WTTSSRGSRDGGRSRRCQKRCGLDDPTLTHRGPSRDESARFAMQSELESEDKVEIGNSRLSPDPPRADERLVEGFKPWAGRGALTDPEAVEDLHGQADARVGEESGWVTKAIADRGAVDLPVPVLEIPGAAESLGREIGRMQRQIGPVPGFVEEVTQSERGRDVPVCPVPYVRERNIEDPDAAIESKMPVSQFELGSHEAVADSCAGG